MIQYGRKYGWGFCDAFDDKYSDFGRLYRLLMRKNEILLIHSYRCDMALVS